MLHISISQLLLTLFCIYIYRSVASNSISLNIYYVKYYFKYMIQISEGSTFYLITDFLKSEPSFMENLKIWIRNLYKVRFIFDFLIQNLISACFIFVYCLVFLQPWRRRRRIPLKHRLTFSGLRNIISQKRGCFQTLQWEPHLPHNFVLGEVVIDGNH
jgi:hypothetical protein